MRRNREEREAQERDRLRMRVIVCRWKVDRIEKQEKAVNSK